MGPTSAPAPTPTTGVTMKVQVCVLLLLAVIVTVHSHSHGPRQGVYAEGVSLDNLPDGGWTGWFNSDGPSGSGDKETWDHIVQRYGRSCSRGIPCDKEDVVVAQVRTHANTMTVERETPEETGDIVNFGLDGFSCMNDDQPDGIKCQNYEVRFFCKGCSTENFCCMPNSYDLLKRILNMN